VVRHTPATPDIVVRTPDTPQPAPVPAPDGSGTVEPGTTPPVVDVPVVFPVPIPQPNPEPIPNPEPPAAEPPAEPPDVDEGPVIALPPPVGVPPPVPPPTEESPSPKPQPSPAPIRISDRRAVQTDGGMAIFTCTAVDVLALEAATPAPGYEVGPVRIREESRMDVVFVAPTADARIDARCEDGAVDASVN
jgi:hypothetical protein